MSVRQSNPGLRSIWVPVRDDRGHTHLESRWVAAAEVSVPWPSASVEAGPMAAPEPLAAGSATAA